VPNSHKVLACITLLLTLALLIPLTGCGGGGSANGEPTPTSKARSCTVSSPSGDVQVQISGAETWEQASAGMKLNEGDRVKTGNDGKVLLLFFEGSAMEIEADSNVLIGELSIAAGTGSTSVRLTQMLGNTINRVSKLVDSASEYEVETPAGSAVVRGTVFKVHVKEDGNTTVGCEEGDVIFSAAGEEVAVSEGMESSASPGETPSEPVYTFLVGNVKICSEVRGNRDYTLRANATFNAGETVWIYFEATGFASKQTNGKYEVWYRATNVEVYDSDGDIYLHSTEPVDFHQAELKEIPDYVCGALHFDILEEAVSGQYRATIALEDVFSGGTESITVYFNVKS
jgi:hypothetical protein